MCSGRHAPEPREAESRPSAQLVEQHLGVLEIGGVEALGEPAIDGGEQLVSLAAFTLVGPQAGEAGRRAQLERLGALSLRDLPCQMEARLGVGATVRRLNQQKLAPEPVKLGLPSPLAARVGERECLGDGALPCFGPTDPAADVGQKC
jgi:hypothetical protein